MSLAKGHLTLLMAAAMIGQGVLGLASSVAAKEHRAGAGKALSVMFDTHSGSRIKARSFLQRTFFDSIGDRDQPLQVAFVIDATDSMGIDVTSVMDSLNGIVDTLRRHKADPAMVSFGLVIFRDVNAPSGRLEFPLGNEFTTDAEALKEALAKVKTETGAPWFEEPVDLAMYEAMTELDWRDADQAVRWVVVFSDAPPYAEGKSYKFGGKRTYSDDELLAKAKETNTYFHTVLCSSGYLFDAEAEQEEEEELPKVKDSEDAADAEADADNEAQTKQNDQDAQEEEQPSVSEENAARLAKLRDAYGKSLVVTKPFMDKMASQTGGVFLDLSDENFRDKLVAEASRKPVDYQAIDVITPEDVQAAKVVSHEEPGDLDATPVRIAVLPHVAMSEMSFDDKQAPVQVATLLREKFRSLPRFEVADPLDVQQKFEGLKTMIGKSTTDDQLLLQKLATDLQVDYVIWGNYLLEGKDVSLTSALYKRVNGAKLVESEKVMASSESVEAKDELGMNNLVLTIAEKLCRQAEAVLKTLGKTSQHGLSAFALVSTDKEVAKAFVTPVSANSRASREMLAGLGALEKALAYKQGAPEAAPFLEQAALRFGAATQIDTDNPLAHAWLASVYFNQVSDSSSTETAEKYKAELEKAYQFRAAAADPNFHTLIEAQYVLIVERDGAKAAGLYESLLAAPASKPLDLALKAHWMLAGIYAGDWGVDKSVVDAKKAREHVIQILAQWPDSPEAKFFTEALRWDEQDGSQHPYVPQENKPVVDSLAALAR